MKTKRFYIIVVLRGDNQFDCIHNYAAYLTEDEARAEIDEIIKEDATREWAYKYRLIKVGYQH